MSVVGDRVAGTIQSSRRARFPDDHHGWTNTLTPTLRATVTDPGDGSAQGLFGVHLDGIGTPILDKACGSRMSFWRDICLRGPG
jgi:hypothetical protein